jgi:hypothetical protein
LGIYFAAEHDGAARRQSQDQETYQRPNSNRAGPCRPGFTEMDQPIRGTILPMKRLRRWLFNALSALSFLLLMTTAVMWVRSHFYWDTEPISWRHAACVESVNGLIELDWQQDTNGHVVAVHQSYSDVYGVTLDLGRHAVWHVAGLGYVRWDLPPKNPIIMFRGILVSYWVLIAIFILLPAYSFWRWLNRKRSVTLGLCTTCGYDLRATPDRCPECGKIPPKTEIISS